MTGAWVMENEGVAPDIEVDDLPGDELAGKDAQLDRAIAEIEKRVKESPSVWPPQPPSPTSRAQRRRDRRNQLAAAPPGA